MLGEKENREKKGGRCVAMEFLLFFHCLDEWSLGYGIPVFLGCNCNWLYRGERNQQNKATKKRMRLEIRTTLDLLLLLFPDRIDQSRAKYHFEKV